MPWEAITAIATVISMIAYVVTALYIRAELKAMEKNRYLEVTNELFAIWQSKEFMESQFWLLHRLQEKNWSDFVRAHRADVGEAAFHRVGAFYDRVGTLIRLGLVNKDEILVTVGACAIAVWQKIGALVQEARRLEQSTLFTDFEHLLPSCMECYVPSLGNLQQVHPFSVTPPVQKPVPRLRPKELKQRLDRGEPTTLLDVRQPAQVALDPRALPSALWMPPEDVATRIKELATDRETVVYCA